jgi:MFS family permease
MTLPAGQIVDRFNKVHIYATCMLVQAAVACLLVWGTHSRFKSPVSWCFFVSVYFGAWCRAFQMPTQQALTPHLVPSHLLQRAVALSSTGVQAAVVGGPALGGILYALHVNAVYASCTLFLLFAFLISLTVRYDHKPSNAAVDLRKV